MFGFKKQKDIIESFNKALSQASYLKIIDEDAGYFIIERRIDCFDVNATEPCIEALIENTLKKHTFNYDYLVNQFNKQNIMLHALVEMIKYGN